MVKENLSQASEAKVIGASLLDGIACEDIASELDTGDFSIIEHAEIFKNIQEISKTTSEIDYLSVIQKNLSQNAATALHGIVADVVTSHGYKDHIKIIKEQSKRNKLGKMASKILLDLESAKGSSSDIGNYVHKEITDIFISSGERTDEDDQKIAPQVLEMIDKRRSGAMTGTPTGFEKFDSSTNGLQPGNMIVIGGRPKMGKTTLSMSLAENIAKFGRVLFISLEMNKNEIMVKRFANKTGINSIHINSGNIREDKMPEFINNVGELCRGNFIIDDSGANSPMRILHTARRRMREKKGLTAVFIDYLQLVKPDSKEGNREREVATISRAFKLMAKELGLPVIVISQLNRGLEKREDKRPTMADLRESGSIEQDADLISFVHRNDPSDPNDKIVEWIIRGYRHGAPGTIKLYYEPEYSRYSDYTGQHIEKKDEFLSPGK